MIIKSPNSIFFYDAFVAATTYFERHIDSVNDLNVFPVPDGDTGTNMYQTLLGIKKRVTYDSDYSVQDFAKLVSDAALWEGRGNSGIILSQIFKGIYLGLKDKNLSDPDIVYSCLSWALNSAYSSISNPTEGTILTALRDITEEANRHADTGLSISELLATLVEKAEESVSNTPEHLKLLKDAGVVDSGAYGLEIFLRGIHLFLSGVDVEHVHIEPRVPSKGGEGVQNLIKDHQLIKGNYGYCTQFVLKIRVESDDVTESFVDMGHSLVVAGGSKIYRIHIHTETPGEVISAATNIGSISGVSIEDMETQSDSILDTEIEEWGKVDNQIGGQTGLVVVAAGSGIDQIFRENGAAAIISGGNSMNPSVADIVTVLDSIQCDTLILLPNNKNIISTAEQAADLSETSVIVIPTNSIAEGLECSAEFDPNTPAKINQKLLLEVLDNVKTISIFKADKTVQIGDVKFQAGCYGAILDDSPLPFQGTAAEILSQALEFSEAYDSDQITILSGEDVTDSERLDLENLLVEQFGDFYYESIQIIEGNQPSYDYIVAMLIS